MSRVQISDVAASDGTPRERHEAADAVLPVGWLERARHEVDAALSAHFTQLKSKITPHSRLLEAVEYSATLSGKRLRPVLALECCEACGGRRTAALPAALALELIHTFSLVHDDLPAMDDDDLRRGQPTNHKVFGEANAILAGDWLLAHAFELLAGAPPAAASRLAWALSRATQDMILGQAADVAGETRGADDVLVQFIHLHKTARLFEAACAMGAIAADAKPAALAAVSEYGRRLGLAFQIVDDLLDRTATTHQLGKTAGKDQRGAKQTYPAAVGEAESRRRAQAEIDAAMAAVENAPVRAERLIALARFVIARDR